MITKIIKATVAEQIHTDSKVFKECLRPFFLSIVEYWLKKLKKHTHFMQVVNRMHPVTQTQSIAVVTTKQPINWNVYDFEKLFLFQNFFRSFNQNTQTKFSVSFGELSKCLFISVFIYFCNLFLYDHTNWNCTINMLQAIRYIWDVNWICSTYICVYRKYVRCFGTTDMPYTWSWRERG